MGFKSTCLAIVALATAVIAAGEINIGESKIVGGQTARPNMFTALVAVEFVDPDGEAAPFLVGGGTLITKNTVLTSADCVYKVTNATDETKLNKYLQGRVGSNKWKEGGQVIKFSSGVTHPKYDRNTFKYNVGFLYTSAHVIFSQTVQPMKIDFDYVGPNVPVIVAGWGAANKDGNDSENLRQLSMVTVDGAKCVPEVAKAAVENNYIYPPVDPKLEICAFSSKDHGTCWGDAGSALIRLDRRAVVGHVVWGIPCATGAPDVFARLSAMKDWIVENIRQ